MTHHSAAVAELPQSDGQLQQLIQLQHLQLSSNCPAPLADGRENWGRSDYWRRKRNLLGGIKQINKSCVKPCDFILIRPKHKLLHLHDTRAAQRWKHAAMNQGRDRLTAAWEPLLVSSLSPPTGMTTGVHVREACSLKPLSLARLK